MVVINKPLDELLDIIGSESPVLSREFNYNGKNSEKSIFSPDNTAWSVIRPELRNILKTNKLFELIDPAEYALENALDYGEFPIFINLYLGGKGGIVSLVDSGEGFDFENIQEKFKLDKRYFHRAGGGFMSFNLKEYLVSFENQGRQTNVIFCEGEINKKLKKYAL